MKYPISKKELQEYDLDNISDDRIKHTFHGLAPCHDFHTHLYNPSVCPERKEYSFDGDIQMIVDELCYDFPQHLCYAFYSKKYIFTPIYVALSKIQVVDGTIGSSVKKTIMDAIIDKLKGLFIDCLINTDKTYSYIYIDWR